MLHVYFDSVEIEPQYIIKCDYSAQIFNGTFKLGTTVCSEFTLWIVKDGVSNTKPSSVQFYEDTTKFATVYVDTFDDSNDYYYEFHLLDKMVNLNQRYSWTHLTNPTVYSVLSDICTTYGITPPAQSSVYYANRAINFEAITTAREFVGYVAELNGAFAYLDANNNLVFKRFEGTILSIDDDDCSDYRLGEKHEITRVVYDNVSHWEAGEGFPGDTLYINPDNYLVPTESDSSMNAYLNTIYQWYAFFGFYNIEITRAPVGYDYPLGSRIRVNLEDGRTPTFICQPKWSYVGGWIGGYSLQVKTELQQETSVIDTEDERARNELSMLIDRNKGLIDIQGNQITNIENNVENMSIHFQVDANKGEARVTNQNTYEPTSYTSFKGDGMRIYVENTQVAEATANRFNCNEGLGVQDWVIEHDDDPSVLMFYRVK